MSPIADTAKISPGFPQLANSTAAIVVIMEFFILLGFNFNVPVAVYVKTQASAFLHHLLGPVAQKKFLFLEVNQFFFAADDGAKGCRHLESDQQKDQAPNGEVARIGHS